MNSLLRSIILASLVGFLVVGCGNKDAAEATSDAVDTASEAVSDTAEAASEAVEAVAETAQAAASSEPGGYEPTEDERVPGITE